jgi:hypothetical protein
MKTNTNLLKQPDLVWSGSASRNITETPFYLQTHLQIDEGLSIPSSLERIESLLAEPGTRAKNLWVELPWHGGFGAIGDLVLGLTPPIGEDEH